MLAVNEQTSNLAWYNEYPRHRLAATRRSRVFSKRLAPHQVKKTEEKRRILTQRRGGRREDAPYFYPNHISFRLHTNYVYLFAVPRK